MVVTRKSSSSSSGSSSSDDEDDDDDDDSSTSDDTDDDTTDDTDDTTDDTTDDGGTVVVNPTSEVDVIEDVLLKDTDNEMDGTTFILIVDDDAFLDAITNALAKKKIEEGDGSDGILAHPYVSFPKANSVDSNQSVKVKLDGAAVQSAFNQEVGLILTLDNYTMIVQPKSFSTDLVDDKVEDYLISKRILEEEDITDAKTKLGTEREVIYAAEASIGYTTENGKEGTQRTYNKPISVSIMLDSTIAAEIEAAEDMSDIVVFVEDSASG